MVSMASVSIDHDPSTALLASISAGSAEAGEAEQAASYIVRSHTKEQPDEAPAVRLRLTAAAGGGVQVLMITRSVCYHCERHFVNPGRRTQHERGECASADREAGGLSKVEPSEAGPIVRLRLTAAAGGGVQARMVTRSVCYHCERHFVNAGCRPRHERTCASRGPEHWSASAVNGRSEGDRISRQQRNLCTDLVGSEPRSSAPRSGAPRKLQFACPK